MSEVVRETNENNSEAESDGLAVPVFSGAETRGSDWADCSGQDNFGSGEIKEVGDSGKIGSGAGEIEETGDLEQENFGSSGYGLEELRHKFWRALNKYPATEKPLLYLVEIEDFIRESIRVRGLAVLNEIIDAEVANIMADKDISYLLDEISFRAEMVILGNYENQSDVEGLMKKLGVLYIKIKNIILPTEPSPIITGSGNGFEKVELQNDKLKILLLLLNENEVYADDLIVLEGKLSPNMVRNSSYLYIEIPRLDKTVLLNREYGEVTFVLEGIHEREEVFRCRKERLAEKYSVRKITFSDENTEKFKIELWNALFLKLDGENVVMREKMNIEKFNSKQELISAIRAKVPTAEEWMEMNFKQKGKFKLWGKGLKALCSILLNTTGDPVGYSTQMAELGKVIYGEGHEVLECELWDKERWILEIRQQIPTPEEWMEMSKKQKGEFKLLKRGLCALYSILLNKTGNPVSSWSQMAEMGKVIYGEEHAVLECELWDKERWILEIQKSVPTAEEWMGMSAKQKGKFKLFGKGLTALYSLLLEKFGSPVCYCTQMAEMGKVIYVEGHEILECELWNKERWILEIRKQIPTPEEWMGMSQKQKGKFKLFGKGLMALYLLLLNTTGNPVNSCAQMAEMGKVIYGEGHEVLECELWNKERWILEIRKQISTPEEWMGMDFKQKKKFKLLGRGLAALYSVLLDKSGKSVGSSAQMAEMGKVIYGEGHEVLECELWDKERWILEIRKSVPTAEGWRAAEDKQRGKFRLFGKGLAALYSVLLDKSGDPVGSSARMAEMGKVIYGENCV